MKFRSPTAALLLLSTALLLAVPAAAAPARHKAHAGTKARASAPARRGTDYQGVPGNFTEWQAVSQFEQALVARDGFERTELDAVLREAHFVDAAVQLVKPTPPGMRKNWQAYRARFIEPVRINAGVQFWNAHAETLARAEVQYGVPAEIIVGILGVETLFGRDTGKFRVVDVLATLAFAYPDTPNRATRMAFFRDELESVLLYARRDGIDPFSVRGSFAGAVGLPQFMPDAILRYGVDYDQDGAVDLRGSADDAIGSVANFLLQHGWQREQPGALVYPAEVDAARQWTRFLDAGLAAQFTPEELAAAGVRTAQAPVPGQRYGLVDLQNGTDPNAYWLASNNFFSITQYNRSYFYAMSVIELGRAARHAREPAPPPASELVK
jgi:membrane-bound lytic murein transglycosylase B